MYLYLKKDFYKQAFHAKLISDFHYQEYILRILNQSFLIFQRTTSILAGMASEGGKWSCCSLTYPYLETHLIQPAYKSLVLSKQKTD